MGTLLAISLPVSAISLQGKQLRAAFAMATRAEAVMSRFDSASPLSRLNRRAGHPGGVRSASLAQYVRRARSLSTRLHGAFDPTVAPVVDCWRRAARRGDMPTLSALTRALACVGVTRLLIRGDRVALARQGMALDLGGIGKGLALDRIAAMLRRRNCRSACLNFGESTLVAIGGTTGGTWRVALRDPFGAGFLGDFALRDSACSTSSTLGQTIQVQGRVLGHIINPGTGQPLSSISQATVLARSAAVAEAVSTALLVLGRNCVEEIARQMKVEICWIDRAGIYATSGFMLRRAPSGAEGQS